MKKNIYFVKLMIFIFCLVTITLFSTCVYASEVTITGGGNGTGGSLPMGTGMTGAAYGNNTYVIVGASGFILKSSDAVNWSTVKDSNYLNVTYNEVEFGNGVFVAVGSGGTIITSTDGNTWTQQTSGTTNALNDVKFINGKFYVVGSSGTVLTSIDGISWTSINIVAGTNDFMHIAYGNGKYAIGCRNSSGGSCIYYSTTGATNSWTGVTINGITLNDITFLKDRFFIFTSETTIYTSTDASNWTTLANANLTSPSQIFHGIYDGSKYYFFGYNGNSGVNSYGAVFTSTDGINFTAQTMNAYIVAQNAAYVNGKYFQLGNESFVVSDDGTNWRYAASGYSGVASNGTNYVAVGGMSEGEIFVSPDWQSWTKVTPSYIKDTFNDVTYGGGKYVAVGNAHTGSNSIAATSLDGDTWTIGNSGFTDSLRAVAYGNNKYVAVGINGRIISSADGVSWISRDTGSGYNFYDVAYINNYFVAVGGAATVGTGKTKVKYSIDGENWIDASPDIVGHFQSIAYGGGKYLLVGRDNVSGSLKFFSITAADVTNTASYSSAVTVPATPSGDLTSVGYGGVAYGNGVFVAIGNGKTSPPNEAYILTSEDGTSWTTTDANTNGRLRGIIYTGGNFKVVGMADTKLTVIAGQTNTNPIVSANNSLTLNMNTSAATITNTMLHATDAEQAPTALTYTIGTGPVKGTLKVNGVTLSSFSTFTQDDIDNGRITYTPSADQSGADSFTFNVSDGAGGNLSNQIFNINITEILQVKITTGKGLGRADKKPAYANVKIPFTIDSQSFSKNLMGYSFDVIYDPAKIGSVTVDSFNGLAKPTIGAPSPTADGLEKVTVTWNGTFTGDLTTLYNTNKSILFKLNFVVNSAFTSGQTTPVKVAAGSFTFTSGGATTNITGTAGNIMFGIYGDVNGDGAITSSDTNLINKYVSGKTNTITGEEKLTAADVDGDGGITSADAKEVSNYISGKVSTLKTLFGY